MLVAEVFIPVPLARASSPVMTRRGKNKHHQPRLARACGEWRPVMAGTCAGVREGVRPPVSRFSTGWLQSLVVGACERVMSMHRSDGQCRPAWRCEELFRWRGGFRDECVPTTCCARGGEAACN